MHESPVDAETVSDAAQTAAFYEAIAYGEATVRLVQKRPLDPSVYGYGGSLPFENQSKNKSVDWNVHKNEEHHYSCAHVHSRAPSAGSEESASDSDSLFSCETCEVGCIYAVVEASFTNCFLLLRAYHPQLVLA